MRWRAYQSKTDNTLIVELLQEKLSRFQKSKQMICMICSSCCPQIPFYAAFSKNNDIILDMVKNEDVRPMLVLSLIVDCMFILDIFLNFRTTFIKPSSDVLEKNPKKLAVYYLRTWFIIDLLAAIPFDWIMHTSTTDGHSVS